MLEYQPACHMELLRMRGEGWGYRKRGWDQDPHCRPCCEQRLCQLLLRQDLGEQEQKFVPSLPGGLWKETQKGHRSSLPRSWQSGGIRTMDLGSSSTWVRMLALFLTSCVTFGKALNLSVPWFSLSKAVTVIAPTSWGGTLRSQ